MITWLELAIVVVGFCLLLLGARYCVKRFIRRFDKK